jgi:T5SS/PEP-CTERM-associated repeat protein
MKKLSRFAFLLGSTFFFFQVTCAQTIVQDGALYLAAPGGSLLADEGESTGDVIGLANSDGGYVFTYQNPAAEGSFSDNNWGAEYFAGGSPTDNENSPGVYDDLTIDGNEVLYQVTSYIGPQFVPAPGVDDTAVFTPIDTDNLFQPGIPVSELTEQGVGNGELTAGYFYSATAMASASYTVNLGSNTVAQTVALGETSATSFLSDDDDLVQASPNFELGGTYTSTDYAILEATTGTPINFSGSGTFATANLGISGQVNVNGGTLQGDKTFLVNSLPPVFTDTLYVFTGTASATSTTVTLSGSTSVLNASTYLVVGTSSDPDEVASYEPAGPTTLSLMDGASANTGMDGSDTSTGAYINGTDEDDFASVTVDGSGTTWKNTGNLAIGFYADAPSSLAVSNGGDVSVSGELVIGSGKGGLADVDIESGGTLEAGTAQDADGTGVSIGDAENSTGTVEAMGAGSKLMVVSSLSIGTNGTGTLTLSNGGSLEVDGSQLSIGSEDGTGTLTVTGELDDGGDDSGDAVKALGFRALDAGLTTSILITKSGSQFLIGNEGVGSLNFQNGADAKVTAGEVIVGNDDGNGTLNIEDSSNVQLTAEELSLGDDEGTGTMSVSGSSGGLHPIFSLMTQAGLETVGAYIGDSGTGIFNASGGAQVTMDSMVTVGNEIGSKGTVTLSDPNTSLNIDQDPIIGMDGTGTVVIQGGAGLTVMSGDLILGQGTTGLGSLQIMGTGTTLLEEGDLIVGGASTLNNTMNVSADGLAQIEGNGIVGRDAGSNGNITVDGTGSTLQIKDLTIGQSGTGTVTVQNSGTLTETGDLILAQNANSNGTLTVDGSGTTFSYTGGDIVVGSAGTGTVTVQNGALVDVSGTTVTLGDENTGNGTLVATDDNTQLNTGDLTVGGSGMGALTVKDNATLISGPATIGDEANSTGTATITGEGSTWTTSDLTVGAGGTGELNIDDGGLVSASGDKLTLGDESTGDGTITLSNAGSALKFTGEIDDGENGKGLFAVQGGASLTAFSMNIGDKGTGNGTLNVDGSGTTMEVQQDFNVGEEGTGALNVTDGAHFLNDADATLADLGGSGTAVIDSNSVWTIGGDLSVGHQGIGGLQVTAKSFVSASNVTLGEIAGGGAGTGIISGSDSSESSTLEYDNILKVGDGGNGELDVDFGATVKDSGKGNQTDAGSLDIAVQTGSSGKVKVDGAGSSLSATNINVGGTATSAGGTGSLSATNGGAINASGAVTVQAKGTVAIEANSSLTAADGVTVNAGGLLGGGGTIHGNVANSGTVAPGDPQTTTIDGNYTQTAGGFLMLTLAGAKPGDYDRLEVKGDLTLDAGATLQLDFIDGFAPTIGETFNLVDYGSLRSLTTDFTTVDITGLATGFNYTLTPVGIGGTDFQFTALNNGVSTTPEPSTYLLVLAGMSFLALRMREKSGPNMAILKRNLKYEHHPAALA